MNDTTIRTILVALLSVSMGECSDGGRGPEDVLTEPDTAPDTSDMSDGISEQDQDAHDAVPDSDETLQETPAELPDTPCIPTGPEDSEAACGDLLDNDCDDSFDCADADCEAFCSSVPRENTADLCSDERDNDWDGQTDCADADCEAFCSSVPRENTADLCSDERDNDWDGQTDCADADCLEFCG